MSFDIVTIGENVVDHFLPVNNLPKRDEEFIFADGVITQLGGYSNFFCQAHRLGLKAANIGVVGNDENGHFYITSLKSINFDTSRILMKEGKTRFFWIIVDKNGNHVFITVLGSNYPVLTAEDIDIEFICHSKMLYASRLQFLPDKWTNKFDKALSRKCSDAIIAAKEAGVKIFFDGASSVYKYPDKVLELVSYCNVVAFNENESKTLTKKSTPEECADYLLKAGPELVAVKLGNRGCYLSTKDDSIRYPAFKVQVLDETCAGDTFNAGLLFGYMKKWPLEKTAILANAMGAIVVTKYGGGVGVPTKDEIIRFLNSRDIKNVFK